MKLGSSNANSRIDRHVLNEVVQIKGLGTFTTAAPEVGTSEETVRKPSKLNKLYPYQIQNYEFILWTTIFTQLKFVR